MDLSEDILIVRWLPLVVVLVAEHIFLTFVYNKRSSLHRLCMERSDSCRTDIAVWFFYYVIIPSVSVAWVVIFITFPGLITFAFGYFIEWWDWKGLLGIGLPENRFLQIIIWLLAIDLAIYLAHVAMHKVPVLWNFHRLHHASSEMNIITGTRVSIGEHFLNDFFLVLLMTVILGVVKPDIYLTVILVRRIIDLLQHSDLPWSYGPIGYIIASPRFHRLHHSSQRENFDSNYGNIFSLWDYLFSTVGSRYRISTGAADTCPLGLATAEETERLNGRWYFALFFDSLPANLWTLYQRFRRLTVNRR